MLSIVPIPALKDNYIWAIVDADHRQALIIDPGASEPVEIFLQKHELTLRGILLTHHHWDHTNGVSELIRERKIAVAGPAHEDIASITLPVEEGIQVSFPHFPLTLSVLNIPGHTLGHIAYVFDNNVFCGDTLFAAGCGRAFEGTTDQLYHSLQKIAALPDDTAIYCAHEYTLNNLRFAVMVEPRNQDISERLERVNTLRQHQMPSLPSFLIEEKRTNPFLRCHINDVIAAAESHAGRQLDTPEDVFAVLRQWKDHF